MVFVSMKYIFFSKMEPHHIPAVPLRALWKAILQVSSKKKMNGLANLRIAISWLSVWDSLSERVYSGRTTAFREEELKDAIRQKWREIPQDEVQKAILSWKKTVASNLR